MKWPEEAASYGPVRLAIIPIGAFRFYAGQMSSGTHIGPRDAVKIFEGLKASRSEEHTSELQSLMRISYADFCLKKKKQNATQTMGEKRCEPQTQKRN